MPTWRLIFDQYNVFFLYFILKLNFRFKRFDDELVKQVGLLLFVIQLAEFVTTSSEYVDEVENWSDSEIKHQSNYF